jgi:hypothetical protein
MKKMSPTIQIIIGLFLVAFGATLGIFGTYLTNRGLTNRGLTNRGIERNREPNKEDTLDISLQKVSIFHVEVDKDFYQLGVVLRFLNLDDKPLLIESIHYENLDYTLTPRSSLHFHKIYRYQNKGEIIENNYVKANDISEIKFLLPMKLNITILHKTPPEIIFFGDWDIEIKETRIGIKSDFYGNYDKTISLNDWNMLLKPSSEIDPENIKFKRSPKKISKTGPDYYYLMFNPDRSSKIEIYGFHNTSYVKNKNGVMVFLMGKGEPPLYNGWVILGNTYSEVWRDQAKLQLYNSVHPPGKDGKPKMFGTFSGHSKLMLGK